MPSRSGSATPTLPDFLLALAALALGACQADLSGGKPGAGQPPGPGAAGSSGTAGAGGGAVVDPLVFSPAGGAFKRLTASEYLGTVRALLGDVQIGELEPDTFVEGFAKVGSAQVAISLNGVEKYELAAEAVTQQVFS